MSRSLLVSVLVLFLLMTVAAAQSCSNPLFSGQITLASTPTTGSNLPCSTFNGASSCCVPDTVAQLNSAMGQARAALKDAFSSTQSSMTSSLQQVSSSMQQAVNQMVAAVKQQYNVDNSAAVQSAMNQMTNTLNSFGNSFLNSAQSCAQAVLNYAAGMVCFACDPNWANFVSGSGANLTLTLNIGTCDTMEQSCVGMFNSADSLVTAVYTLFSALYKGTPLASQFSSASPPKICSTVNCRNLICNSMVAGTGYSGGSLGNIGSLFPVGPTAASAISTAALHDALANADAERVANEVTNLVVRHLGLDRAVVSNRATTNTYSSTGYNATSVGSSSSLDRSTSGVVQGGSGGAAAHTTSSLAMLGTAVLAILAALFF